MQDLKELNGIIIRTCKTKKDYMLEVNDKMIVLRNKHSTFVIELGYRTNEEVLFNLFDFIKNNW